MSKQYRTKLSFISKSLIFETYIRGYKSPAMMRMEETFESSSYFATLMFASITLRSTVPCK